MKLTANGKALSYYTDELADAECITMQIGRLNDAYSLSEPFGVLLMERIIENGFTKKRLQDAVIHYIDNSVYPPKIADIISFDKTIPFYSHKELLEKYGQTQGFEAFKLPNGAVAFIQKLK